MLNKSGIRRHFDCGIRNQSWTLKSRIQLKESGIPLTIGIQNPSSIDRDCNSVPEIRNPRRAIQKQFKTVWDSLTLGESLYQIRFLFLGRSAWYNKVRFGEDERKCSYACVGKLSRAFEPLKSDDLMDERLVFIKSYLS